MGFIETPDVDRPSTQNPIQLDFVFNNDVLNDKLGRDYSGVIL